jgi:hypothetical protein
MAARLMLPGLPARLRLLAGLLLTLPAVLASLTALLRAALPALLAAGLLAAAALALVARALVGLVVGITLRGVAVGHEDLLSFAASHRVIQPRARQVTDLSALGEDHG